MNVADSLLLQQMQGIVNLPKIPSNPKNDPSGSFQDLMDQAGQDSAAVETGKKDQTAAEQKPAQKDETGSVKTESKPAENTQKTEETTEVDPNAAVYALDLFRPEIVDISEPVEEVLAAAAPAEAVETVPVTAEPEAVVPVVEAAPETADIEVPAAETAVEEAPAVETPEVQAEAPKAEAVQETVRPAEVQKPVESVETEAPQETKEISDTGEVRDVRPEEKSEDTNSEDLSGEMTQMNQQVFHDVKAAPVKVADTYEPVDTQKPDMDVKLAADILQAVQNGTEQMQIRLNPANLGAITIDLAKDVNGALQVVIHASNSRAAGLLNEHLDGLHTAIQSHGTEQTVHVEVQRPQEGQEQHMFQHADPDGRGQHQRQQEERRQENDDSGEDFLQKLRLGLNGMED